MEICKDKIISPYISSLKALYTFYTQTSWHTCLCQHKLDLSGKETSEFPSCYFLKILGIRIIIDRSGSIAKMLRTYGTQASNIDEDTLMNLSEHQHLWDEGCKEATGQKTKMIILVIGGISSVT